MYQMFNYLFNSMGDRHNLNLNISEGNGTELMRRLICSLLSLFSNNKIFLKNNSFRILVLWKKFISFDSIGLYKKRCGIVKRHTGVEACKLNISLRFVLSL